MIEGVDRHCFRIFSAASDRAHTRLLKKNFLLTRLTNEFRSSPQGWPGLRQFQQDLVMLHLLALICSMLASFSGKLCSRSGQMAQSSSRQSSSQLQVQTEKKKSLFSNYLQLGPIGQAWNTGFHQGQEWGQPLSHSEWLLEDNHSATTRRRGDARWAQV